MQDVTSVNQTLQQLAGYLRPTENSIEPGSSDRPERPPHPPHPPHPPRHGADRVELSPEAAGFDVEAADAQRMDERIREIRAQIADGTYLSEDKIDFIVERLLEELGA